MWYSAWGRNGLLVSRLGFGCTRFLTEDLQSKDGIGRCVALAEHAIEAGINYFDVAPTYARGLAESILGQAFSHSTTPVYVAAKTGLLIDRTADELLRRLNTSLKLLHKEQIEFYHIWSVMNREQYQRILQPGGLYEGAWKAKRSGLIQYLCISCHCDVQDTLEIIKDGRFDGITISMNAMNYEKWIPILQAAHRREMGVVTMNSLGGGIIPAYQKLFDTLDNTNDSVAVKALRFLSSFSEISVLLSGMATAEQIDENCSAFMEPYPGTVGMDRAFQLTLKSDLCSGCNYCAPCPVGLPVSACMQAYNYKIFAESSGLSREKKQIANEMFTQLRANGTGLIDLASCISCKKCEQRCTQKLNIVNRLGEMKELANIHGYTKEAMQARLYDLEKECVCYRKIGIWPAGHYADSVLSFWGNSEFEARCEFFNSSPSLWGKAFRKKAIYGPSELKALEIEVVIIMHYRLQEEIYRDLLCKIPPDIRVIKLHRHTDIDWFTWEIRR